MSDIDNRWEIYNSVCKDRFQNMENKIDRVHDHVEKLTAIVTNGLSDDVTHLKKWNTFIVTGIITLLGTLVTAILVYLL